MQNPQQVTCSKNMLVFSMLWYFRECNERLSAYFFCLANNLSADSVAAEQPKSSTAELLLPHAFCSLKDVLSPELLEPL